MNKFLSKMPANKIGLIITFFVLYLCVGVVSTLHSIEFFALSNNQTLASFLGIAYEVGQVAVLFAILTTNSKNNMTAWFLMVILTGLQITGNVYSSYKYIELSNSDNWMFWRDSILFWMTDVGISEKVVIAWISGSLLPVVALGLTAMLANILNENNSEDNESINNIDNINENINEVKLSESNEMKLDNEQQEIYSSEIIEKNIDNILIEDVADKDIIVDKKTNTNNRKTTKRQPISKKPVLDKFAKKTKTYNRTTKSNKPKNIVSDNTDKKVKINSVEPKKTTKLKEVIINNNIISESTDISTNNIDDMTNTTPSNINQPTTILNWKDEAKFIDNDGNVYSNGVLIQPSKSKK